MSKNKILLAFLCLLYSTNSFADYIYGQREYASGNYEVLFLNGLKLLKMEMQELNITLAGCMQMVKEQRKILRSN